MSVEKEKVDPQRLVMGVLLVLVGTGFLLARLLQPAWHGFWRLSPLILAAWGVAVLLRDRAWRCNLRQALWLEFIAGWLLLGFWGGPDFHFGRSWPLFLLFAGALDLVLPRPDRARADGLLLLLVGSWLLATQYHFLGLEMATSWPLVLVIVGVLVLVRGVRGVYEKEKT